MPRPYESEMIDRNAPNPGIAAVLSVLMPGLGQVYCGRLFAGAIWFLATAAGYSLILVPGFLIHALCVWSAYASARDWDGY
jgi:TM2 domain-containing membrane protein YozV